MKIKIEKVVTGGDGLGFMDGKAIFVPGALAGETVMCNIIEEKRGFSRAELVEILITSPNRTHPVCNKYGICGGCDLMHTTYEHQLSIKSEICKEAFRRIGGMDLETIEVVPSKPLAYRNRVQFHKSANRTIGFKKRSANEIIPIDTCPIACETINTFLSKKEFNNQLDSLEDRFVVIGTDEKVYFQPKEHIDISLGGKKVSFGTDVFFQNNIGMIPDIAGYMGHFLQGETLLDLYCGVGLFGTLFSDRFEHIISVEMSKKSIGWAKTNIPGSENHTFFAGDVDKWLKTRKKTKKYDTILVDPPRNGLSKKMRSFLSAVETGILMYVSCNPVTQARDIKELAAGGYKLLELKAFDFYPQTSHIESVAILKR